MNSDALLKKVDEVGNLRLLPCPPDPIDGELFDVAIDFMDDLRTGKFAGKYVGIVMMGWTADGVVTAHAYLSEKNHIPVALVPTLMKESLTDVMKG